MRSPRGVDSMTMGMTESGRAGGRQEEGRREGEEVEGMGAKAARPTARDCRRKKVCHILICLWRCVGRWV